MRVSALLCFFTTVVPVTAGTIYRIDFEGTIKSGTVSSATTTSQSQTPVDITGATVRGHMVMDLSLAPAPVDSSDATSSTRVYSDVDGPAWLQGYVVIDVPVLPADFLYVPSALTIGPVNAGPGFTPTTPPAANRSLSATNAEPCCDVMVPNISFFTTVMDGSGRLYTNNSVLGLLLFPATSFLPSTPPFPAPFAIGPTASTSKLIYLGFERDTTSSTGPLFGISSSFQYNVDFEVTSASGQFVPEPANLLLCGATLVAVALRRKWGGQI